MATTTIHISESSRDILRELARTAGLSMQEVLDQAIENYRRQSIMAQANAAYAALHADPAAWQGYREELEAWDTTLTDGLENY